MERTYFTNLGTTEYELDSRKYTIKDFWNRFIMYLETNKEIYDYYQIKDGQSFRDIALFLYGREDYDWIIQYINGYLNELDFPMNQEELYDFCIMKYGSEDALKEIHHYLTPEVKNTMGFVSVPSNVELSPFYSTNAPFRFNDLNENGDQVYRYLTSQFCKPITNYEYEVIENEKKRTIKVLKARYFDLFLEEFRNSQLN